MDISGGVTGFILNQFTGFFSGTFEQQRDAAVKDAQDNVKAQLNVDDRLGPLIRSLLQPPTTSPTNPPDDVSPVLAYTSVEIRQSGIVLHGTVAADWPAAHVEFEQIPLNSAGRWVRACNSATGRTTSRSIAGFLAARLSSTNGASRPTPFRRCQQIRHVAPTAKAPPRLRRGESSERVQPALLDRAGFAPVGLRAGRLSTGQRQHVRARLVRRRLGHRSHARRGSRESDADRAGARRSRPGGRPCAGAAGRFESRIPNRIVHFADARTSGSLEFLTQALNESGRSDAPTVVLAVLTSDQLTKARHVEGIAYAEDTDGAWGRTFGLATARRPVTLVVAPDGKTLWRHEGDLDSPTLATKLRRLLASDRPLGPRLSGLNLGSAGSRRTSFSSSPRSGVDVAQACGTGTLRESRLLE